MTTYTPRGWRRLFPHYWRLAERLERRDLDIEMNLHRDIDVLFAKQKLEYIREARAVNAPSSVYLDVEARINKQAEDMHRLLEERGVRRRLDK